MYVETVETEKETKSVQIGQLENCRLQEFASGLQ